jgi:hypothetical protein
MNDQQSIRLVLPKPVNFRTADTLTAGIIGTAQAIPVKWGKVRASHEALTFF